MFSIHHRLASLYHNSYRNQVRHFTFSHSLLCHDPCHITQYWLSKASCRRKKDVEAAQPVHEMLGLIISLEGIKKNP